MPEHATLEIVNRLGLHARAAALLVQTASKYDAEVTIAKDGQVVNGRSIMGVMMLAAEQGSRIEVTAAGPQAQEALEAIRALVAARFHEPE
jgi:phosphocarrier protein HPr